MREENQFTVMDPFDELDLSSDEIFDFYSPESPKQTLISKFIISISIKIEGDGRSTSSTLINKKPVVEDLEDGDRTSQPKDKVVTWNLPFRKKYGVRYSRLRYLHDAKDVIISHGADLISDSVAAMCHLLVVSGEAEVLGGNMKKQIMDESENLSLN
ncbi:hypothetical protein YC2023_100681 [Brassica napus]